MGKFIKHVACQSCGSSDANALYDSGDTHCFSCGANTRDGGLAVTVGGERSQGFTPLEGSYRDLPKRGIREGTCAKYGYLVSDGCHIANYRDGKGVIVAQKVRRPNKVFSIAGNGRDMPLFGQHLWGTGKSVVITEGEIDCLSVAQAFDCKWPVVSLPNGAQAGLAAVKRAYEWLLGFDRVVLCFDMDDAGQKAVLECAEALPPGKAYIMKLERKDANDVLVNDGSSAITKAYWNAQPWRPDGILSGSELTRERLQKESTFGYSTPYPRFNELYGGMRTGELLLLTAGSGVGKSTFAREIAYHLQQVHGLTIGNIFLEEGVEKTAKGYVALHNNVSLGRLRADPSLISDEKWDDAIRDVVSKQYFYDHFGSLNSDYLLGKMRYLRIVCKCDFVILDHLSIVVSGQTDSPEGERRSIDVLMTKLRSLIEETGLGVIAIVHLNSPEGKPHEEGGRVTLKNLRGSGSFKQLSDGVVALERDQQGDNKNESVIRVLKNREFGDVGASDTLEYNKDTGRLLPLVNPMEI